MVIVGVFFLAACGDGSEFKSGSTSPVPTQTPVEVRYRVSEADFRTPGPTETGVANPEPTATPAE
jgi:hypothetical protein